MALISLRTIDGVTQPRLYTVQEVANMLLLTPQQAKSLPIRRIKKGRAHLFDHDDLVRKGYLSPDNEEQNLPAKQYVYFVRGGSKVKIGTAKNPRKRIASLQCGSPIRLCLIGYVPGGSNLEKEFHERWKHQHAWGEWFNGSRELTAFIKEVCNGKGL